MERNGTAIKNRIVNLHKININRYINTKTELFL